MPQYLIWSNEHRAWWRPEAQGYSTLISAAGRYDQEEAIEICRNANRFIKQGELPNEIPVLEADARECMRLQA